MSAIDSLIEELLKLEDPAGLQAAIATHGDRMDAAFFEALARSVYQRAGAGDRVGAQRRRLLLDLLLEARPGGRAATERVDSEQRATREALLRKLESQLAAARSDAELDAMVSQAQPMIPALLQRLEQPELLARIRTAQARVLRSLRTAVDDGARLMEQALRARDPRQVLTDHASRVHDGFFAVLAANLETARERNRPDVEQALLKLRDLAGRLRQEG